MTKAQLVKRLTYNTQLDPQQALVAVEAFMRVIKETMVAGENIYLRGFGTFHLHKRRAKPARNIRTKEKLVVPARMICKFKPCKTFAEHLKKAVPAKDNG